MARLLFMADYCQSCGFSSSHIQMWELDHTEGWVLKNWCLWTVELEKTLESRWDRKEIKPVNPKGNQLWIFTGRTDAEALILGHIMQRDNLLKKILMLGKIEDRRGWPRMRWLDSITNSKDMNLSKLWLIVEDRGNWLAAVHEVAKSQRQLKWLNNKKVHSLH